MFCPDYCGLACVNNDCPNIICETHPEYGFEPVSCAECFYYGGCDDCTFIHMSEICSEEKKAKYMR